MDADGGLGEHKDARAARCRYFDRIAVADDAAAWLEKDHRKFRLWQASFRCVPLVVQPDAKHCGRRRPPRRPASVPAPVNGSREHQKTTECSQFSAGVATRRPPRWSDRLDDFGHDRLRLSTDAAAECAAKQRGSRRCQPCGQTSSASMASKDAGCSICSRYSRGVDSFSQTTRIDRRARANIQCPRRRSAVNRYVPRLEG